MVADMQVIGWMLVLPSFLYGLFAGMLFGYLWRRGRNKRRRLAQERRSPLAKRLMSDLMGNDSAHIIEAAELLGEARDVTAVPVLILALERCIETQPPGWSERAAALATALGKIGDRRALPLLYKLDNVRGIGLISAVRNAIASIEPQTSLLRPGSAEDVAPELLLRPVTLHSDSDPDARRTLLRTTDQDHTNE